MKLKSLALIMALLLTFLVNSIAQCPTDDLQKKCVATLEGFVYLKSFNVVHSKSQQISEHSYIFTKGTSYMLSLCDQSAADNRLVVELYDGGRKLVSTNYAGGKYYAKMMYACENTGIYYMKYKFIAGQPSCGVGVIGFKK